MWLLWGMVILPIIEIALFIQVGGAIGLWPTLALVVLAAVLGVSVMRAQGARAVAEIQSNLSQLRDPSRPMAHGAMIMLAGMLLVVPGFFTDVIGLLLLLPPVRGLVMRRVSGRIRVQRAHVARRHADPYRPPYGGGVIDGDYIVEDDALDAARRMHPPLPDVPPRDDDDAPRGGSGWTRH